VNFREFRNNLSGYLRQVRLGASFVVTSRGVEVARIEPPVQKPHQKLELIGMFKDRLRMASDFDETPDELIAVMENGV
jgi:antitoxin (DNA-binding transcriptional repressor) of toxin-antitoxin stability system